MASIEQENALYLAIKNLQKNKFIYQWLRKRLLYAEKIILDNSGIIFNISKIKII